MCGDEVTETLEQWLTRMDTFPPTRKRRKVEWVLNGHGQILDPERDSDGMDDVARTNLARLRSENRS